MNAPVKCPGCSLMIAVECGEGVRPWCPRCGADVRPVPAALCPACGAMSPPTPDGAPRLCPRCQADRALQERAAGTVPGLDGPISLSWSEPPGFLPALGAPGSSFPVLSGKVLAALTLLAAATALSAPEWILGAPVDWADQLTWLVVFAVFAALGLPICFLALNSCPSAKVEVGAEGIRRKSVVFRRHRVLFKPTIRAEMRVESWPWSHIQELHFIESYPAGGKRWKVLMLIGADLQQKLLGVSTKVGYEELASVCAAYHHKLHRESRSDTD